MATILIVGPGGNINAALTNVENTFTEPQEIETTGSGVNDAAELQLKTPTQEWGVYTGYGISSFVIRDITAGKFPFNITAGAPDNAFHIDAAGNVSLATANAAEKMHINGGGILVTESDAAFLNGFYVKIVPEFAEEGFHLDYGTTKILYTKEYNAPTALRVALNLVIDTVKSGATQIAAGAAAGEVWKTAGHATLPDNVLMIGV
jgi:hypothetical protein